MQNNIYLYLYLILIIIILIIHYYPTKTIFSEHDKLKILLRQTARWATASKQDENELIAVLHANYAMGYLMAIRDIYTENQIEKILNKPLIEFSKEISEIQDEAHRKAIIKCPEYGPERSFLTELGGE